MPALLGVERKAHANRAAIWLAFFLPGADRSKPIMSFAVSSAAM